MQKCFFFFMQGSVKQDLFEIKIIQVVKKLSQGLQGGIALKDSKFKPSLLGYYRYVCYKLDVLK